jgi:hypothetical protein
VPDRLKSVGRLPPSLAIRRFVTSVDARGTMWLPGALTETLWALGVGLVVWSHARMKGPGTPSVQAQCSLLVFQLSDLLSRGLLGTWHFGRGRGVWPEVNLGLAEEAFCLADAAGHRAVRVGHTGTLGVLSGKQEPAADRLAE